MICEYQKKKPKQQSVNDVAKLFLFIHTTSVCVIVCDCECECLSFAIAPNDRRKFMPFGAVTLCETDKHVRQSVDDLRLATRQPSRTSPSVCRNFHSITS